MRAVLDPKVLIAIKDLSLAAKTTIDGLMSGINKSAIRGQGIEFSQYRSYQIGDDLRALDWKMFARSDRYFIRESEVETAINVRFLIDASASMNHHDGNFTKMDYAKYLVASLAYLANLQGDAIGMFVFKNDEILTLAPKQDYQHLNKLFYQLAQLEPAGTFTAARHYKQVFGIAQKRELAVFVTDLYQETDELFEIIDNLIALKHEVIVLQLMASNELDLNYKGYAAFEDLETGAVIQIDQSQLRATYKKQIETHLENTKIKMLAKKVYYKVLNTNDPLDLVLTDFLKQRTKFRH